MNYRELMKSISAYSCKIELLYGELARQLGKSPYTMTVLYAIEQNQPCTQKQLSDEWLLPKQTVNSVVKDLQKEGYVTLIPGRNQKEKLVSFTELGTEKFRDVMEKSGHLEERVMERLGEEQCTAMLRILQKYAAVFKEELQGDQNGSC